MGVGEALELGEGDADDVGVGVKAVVGVAVGVGNVEAVYLATKLAISADPQPVDWS